MNTIVNTVKYPHGWISSWMVWQSLRMKRSEYQKRSTHCDKRISKKSKHLDGEQKQGLSFWKNLYRLPIVSVRKIEEWTSLSRPQANELVKKFVKIGILEQKDKDVEYGREFWYKNYLTLFLSKEEVRAGI